jgi:hypothetical protein
MHNLTGRSGCAVACANVDADFAKKNGGRPRLECPPITRTLLFMAGLRHVRTAARECYYTTRWGIQRGGRDAGLESPDLTTRYTWPVLALTFNRNHPVAILVLAFFQGLRPCRGRNGVNSPARRWGVLLSKNFDRQIIRRSVHDVIMALQEPRKDVA